MCSQFGRNRPFAHLAHGSDRLQLTGSGLGLARFPVVHALARHPDQLAHVGRTQAEFLAQGGKASYSERNRSSFSQKIPDLQDCTIVYSIRQCLLDLGIL